MTKMSTNIGVYEKLNLPKFLVLVGTYTARKAIEFDAAAEAIGSISGFRSIWRSLYGYVVAHSALEDQPTRDGNLHQKDRDVLEASKKIKKRRRLSRVFQKKDNSGRHL